MDLDLATNLVERHMDAAREELERCVRQQLLEVNQRLRPQNRIVKLCDAMGSHWLELASGARINGNNRYMRRLNDWDRPINQHEEGVRADIALLLDWYNDTASYIRTALYIDLTAQNERSNI